MMADPDDDDDHGGSKVCFMDELVGGHVVDPETKRDVDRFRKAERTRLYGLRKSLSVEASTAQAASVMSGLDRLLPDVAGRVIACYWPIRGELDLRGWMAMAHAHGATLALPVVVAKGRPLEFRAWQPGATMERGIWNIPVPATSDLLVPDIVIAPLLGVDAQNYRLGNGGGYYDMTLAALPVKPQIIGVGQHFCRMATIFPMPWDIPMDAVVLGVNG